jgi:peptidyl-prolyl cis-trans isomerase SurA
MTRKVAILVALSVVSAPLAAQNRDRIIERVVVKVNGEIFTQTDLEQRQIEALRANNQQVKGLDLQNDATLKATLQQLTPDILVGVIDELLLVQHGREAGYNLSDEQFKNVLEQVKKDNKLDDAQLKTALAQEGMTMDSYRQMMERQMIVGAVQRQEIMQKATLTDEEARQYYDKHHDDFMKPATVTLRELLIAVPTEMRDNQQVFNAAADDAAKKKADDTRARLLKGDDFALVAAETSDSASKATGGLIGVVNLDQMNPELRAIIEKIKTGESSEPIRVKSGYQIFKVDARSPAEVEAFDKVRDKISQKVYSERLDGETAKFLEKLRGTALIEWKDDTYKQMYEKAVAVRAAK